MSLWGEIRRRNVFKVGAAYLVVSWLLAQIASVFVPALILPEWVARFVVFMLVLGFPIALILAWAYELTPEGVKRTRDIPLTDSVSRLAGRRLNYILAVLLAFSLGFIVFDRYVFIDLVNPGNLETRTTTNSDTALETTAAAPAGIQPRIAVLPCENLSPEPDNAYFALGIHDEILNQLARISSLLVIARTSVMQYAETRPAVAQIAQDLGATSIMECSVRYAGDGFLISAQLIDPATATNIWSERYLGDRSDVNAIFALQADIAKNIANALHSELLPREQRWIERPKTNSAEAYAIYLQVLTAYRQNGSFNPTTPPGTRAGLLEQLDQALTIDTEFAAAHALRAWIQNDSLWFDPVAVDTWYESKTAVREQIRLHAGLALELDPGLGLAHAALGRLEILAWQRAEAAAILARARELSPNDPEIWQWSGFTAWLANDLENAVSFSSQGIAIDPENPASYAPLALTYLALDDYVQADATGEKYLSLNPAATLGHIVQAKAGIMLDNIELTRRLLRTIDAVISPQAAASFVADLAYGHGRIGEAAQATQLSNRVRELELTNYVGPEVKAYSLFAIGDYAGGAEQLELALQRRAELQLGVDPFVVAFIRDNAWNDPALAEPPLAELRRRLDQDD